VETNALSLPGIYVDVSPIRLYLDGEILAPIIGYTGEISKEEMEKATASTRTEISRESMAWKDFLMNIFAGTAVRNWLKSMFTAEK